MEGDPNTAARAGYKVGATVANLSGVAHANSDGVRR